jgi:hypothetical protein
MESGLMNMGEQGLVAGIVFISLLSPHSSPSTLPDEGNEKSLRADDSLIGRQALGDLN